MGGAIVLAGGHELRPGCEEMDRRVLDRAGGRQARVVFLPTAVARYDPVGSRRGAISYFKRLGARCEVAMILNHDDAERPEMAALIERGTLIYLGGGEPEVLLDALRDTAAWRAIVAAYVRGAVVGGSSAGAMVVCSRTLLPGRGGQGSAVWGHGLGLVPQALVMPHFSMARQADAMAMAASLAAEAGGESVAVLGIPEQCAVLGGEAAWEVAGRGPVAVFGGEVSRSYGGGERFTLPLAEG